MEKEDVKNILNHTFPRDVTTQIMDKCSPQDASMMSKISDDAVMEKEKSVKKSIRDAVKPIIMENMKNIITEARKGKKEAKIFYLVKFESSLYNYLYNYLPYFFGFLNPHHYYLYEKKYPSSIKRRGIWDLQNIIEGIAKQIDKKNNLDYRYDWMNEDGTHTLYAKWI